MSDSSQSPVPVLVAVISVVFLGLCFIALVLYLRPGGDYLPIITIIIGMLMPTLASIFAMMKSQETKNIAEKTHQIVNGRMDELSGQVAVASRAAGILEGMGQQRKITASDLAAKAETDKVTAEPTTLPSEMHIRKLIAEELESALARTVEKNKEQEPKS